MNVLMIEFSIEDTDSSAVIMDLDAGDQPIDTPICIDETHDLIVCKDCGIGGVPFERVPSHLRGNHEIKIISEQVMTHLNLESEAMMLLK